LEPTAQAAQAKRLEGDPWTEKLRAVTGEIVKNGKGEKVERVRSNHLLENVLAIPPERQTPHSGRRLGPLMIELGWLERAIKGRRMESAGN
jgi:hypothetical protein